MDEVLKTILMQAIGYFVAMIIPFMIIGFLMRGFLLKYLKVRGSFNKLIMVKIRSITRDYYSVGKIQDGFLVFKAKKEKDKYDARIPINKEDYHAIYRTLGVNFIDIDEEKSAICKVDYSAVSGLDTKKYNDLMIRCLQRPQIGSNFEKIIIGLVIFAILVSVGCAILGFNNMDMLGKINQQLPTICKAVITAKAGVI